MSSNTQDSWVPVSPIIPANQLETAQMTPRAGQPQGSALRRPTWGFAYESRPTPLPHKATAAPTCNPRHDVRQRFRHSGPSRRPSSSADTQHNNPPHVADVIIARLHKPQAVRSQDEAGSGRPTEPQRPAGDYYRPAKSNQQAPRRLNNRWEYSSWSGSRLLREVNLRHLRHRNEDLPRLVDMLVINDLKFFEAKDDLKDLNVRQLLNNAGRERLDVDPNRHWDHHALLTKIAEQLAQSDSAMSRQTVREYAQRKSAARMERLWERESTQRSDSGYSSRHTRSRSADDNQGTPPINRVGKQIAHHHAGEQGSSKRLADEAQSPTKGKERTHSVESESEEEGEIKPTKKARPTQTPKVEVNQAQPSKSDEKITVASTPIPNKVRTTGPPKAALKRKALSSDSDDDEDTVRSTRPPKRLKARKPEPESEHSSNSSSESDDEEMEKQRKARPRKKAATPKLKGVPASERVLGLPYMKLTDGSFKLNRRTPRTGRPKAKAEPHYNYILK